MGGRPEPLTYYHPTGPVGQALTALLSDRPRARVAAVGLGAGSLAAYAQPGQEWTFYEIDPRVEAIARNSQFFTYLADCLGSCRVVLGDARLSLARAGGERFDFVVLDAFSSDAIPVHLLTREALDLYLSRLEPGGVLAFHISNRHLALGPVLAALFADRGLVGLAQMHVVTQPDPTGRSSSEWVLAARSREGLARLSSDPRWIPTGRQARGQGLDRPVLRCRVGPQEPPRSVTAGARTGRRTNSASEVMRATKGSVSDHFDRGRRRAGDDEDRYFSSSLTVWPPADSPAQELLRAVPSCLI